MPMFTALIVEDNEMVRELLAVTLEPICRPIQTESAEQALDLLERIEPDIAIVDISLGPGRLNGLELCRRLRQNGFKRNLPILILSGSDFSEGWQHALAAGANGFIPKPYSPIKLLDQVSALLGRGEGC